MDELIISKTNNGVIEICNTENINFHVDMIILSFLSFEKKNNKFTIDIFELFNCINSTFKPKLTSLIIPENNNLINEYDSFYEYLIKQQKYILLCNDQTCASHSVVTSIKKNKNLNNLVIILIDTCIDSDIFLSNIAKNIDDEELTAIKQNFLCYRKDNDVFNSLDDKITKILLQNPNTQFHLTLNLSLLNDELITNISKIMTNIFDNIIVFDIIESDYDINSYEEKLNKINLIKEFIKNIYSNNFQLKN